MAKIHSISFFNDSFIYIGMSASPSWKVFAIEQVQVTGQMAYVDGFDVYVKHIDTDEMKLWKHVVSADIAVEYDI